MNTEPPLLPDNPCMMRNRLPILIAGFFLAALPLASAETVYYDGSDPTMVDTNPVTGKTNSLFLSTDISGNTVMVSNTTVAEVMGASLRTRTFPGKCSK